MNQQIKSTIDHDRLSLSIDHKTREFKTRKIRKMNQLENKLANFVKQVTINRALKKIDLC
jgi:hypothetical protein